VNAQQYARNAAFCVCNTVPVRFVIPIDGNVSFKNNCPDVSRAVITKNEIYLMSAKDNLINHQIFQRGKIESSAVGKIQSRHHVAP